MTISILALKGKLNGENLTVAFLYLSGICLKFAILRNVIFRDLKSRQFCQNVLCVALCGQYTIGVLNCVNVLRDKTFNSVCALDRFLPFHSKFFSMPD